MSGYYYYNKSTSERECYGNMPLKYGAVSRTDKEIKPCSKAGCLKCAKNYLECTVCNSASDYHIITDSCYTKSSPLTGYGWDAMNSALRICDTLSCKNCIADYMTCTECLSSLVLHQEHSNPIQCIAVSQLPEGYGLDTSLTILKSTNCAPECKTCMYDSNKCQT